jgi:excinuclease UvrABC ATPase subunit
MSKPIIIRGAREHNLKNINLEIPKNKIVVVTGVSGSGKSSLVFDTVCAEAQRQLIETFSAFARRRLPKISQPDVDVIENLSTAMVIDQKKMGTTLRSTVGTVTEIYTNLRMLFSRCGEPFGGWSNEFSFNNPEGMCPTCHGLGKEMIIDLSKIVDMNLSVRDGAFVHPDFKKGGYFWRHAMKCGFFNTEIPLKDLPKEELHNLLYLENSEYASEQSGENYTARWEGVVTRLKKYFMSKEEGTDAITSFFTYQTCTECNGARINAKARSVKVAGKTIPELVFLELPDFMHWLTAVEGDVAEPLVRKMKQTTQYLMDIGVGYLSLHRPVATLSGGESQRVKMAKQLDCNLVDLLYVLDEPSIGLHPRDVSNLKRMLTQLREKGNSVLVVEHDPDIMSHADYIIDIGPEAGLNGGHILFEGTYPELLKSDTLTAKFLNRKDHLYQNRKPFISTFSLENATTHNLKNVSVEIPAGVFVCITGVAGSGKSSLIHEEFCAQYPDAVVIDQSPAGRNIRSTPMSYTGIFDKVRKEFSDATGKSASLFSFNSEGACSECKGNGIIKVDLSFLDDVTMTCPKCEGKRFKSEILELKMRGKSIHDVLEMTIDEAASWLTDSSVLNKLKIMKQVGLGYLKLGQPLSTLSGGEAQRIKLASELHKKGNIYVMDEPTTGLHMADTERLMGIIKTLVSHGNSVIVIEHNLDVIWQADWVIDLGPDGGKNGGMIVAQGTPEEIAGTEGSYTGQFLKKSFLG